VVSAPVAGVEHRPFFNGTFTLTNRTSGAHRTYRVHTVPDDDPAEGLRGRRIVSILTGPENTSDYTPFGFVERHPDTWGGWAIRVWQRYRSPGDPVHVDAYHWGDDWGQHVKLAAMLLCMMLRRTDCYFADRYDLLEERRCRRCDRALTTPESIEAGIGPVCIQREVEAGVRAPDLYDPAPVGPPTRPPTAEEAPAADDRDDRTLVDALLAIDGEGPRGRLSEWEAEFVESIGERVIGHGRDLSEKQRAIAERIAAKMDV
jgi:hypothetical protein